MNIKRFTGRDMREAMRRVRDTFGPDAVILETVREDDTIAISAAVDFDPAAYQAGQRPSETEGVETAVPAETTAATSLETPELAELQAEVRSLRSLMENQVSRLLWDDHARRRPESAAIQRNLSQLGLTPEMVRRVMGNLPTEHIESAWSASLEQLVHHLNVLEDDPVRDGGIYAVVGPTGAGKTTTIAKLAARYRLHGRAEDIALVTTDTYRIGAREQLETFGRIMGIAVYVAPDADTLGATLRALADKHLVLIDTAGMGQRDLRLARELACLTATEQDIQVLLALPANVQTESLQEIVDAFRIARPVGCILTKMDEATSLGGAFSVLIRAGLPLAYVANGQRVPEDLHFARSRQAWLVKAAVELMRGRGQPINDDYLAENFSEGLADVCA
jgi:flagellar biosynthesis protein FlhF